VTVFFGTDRNTTDDQRTEYALGEQRSNVKYGRAYVSIPSTHKMGKIERPSWLRFEFSENPDRHVVVRRISLYDRVPFLTSLSDEIKRSAGRSSFVFVHGYNVSFADAARRTAQMTYDLGFDGVPVFYSWPSRASTASYTIDEQNIEWSESNISAFLEDVLSVAEMENVYLIAHSMGNRGLTRALRTLMDRQPTLVRKVKEVILAAPDIDADVFRRDLAPALAKLGAGITLYASSSDRALMASRAVHGEQRAGESRPSIMRVRGIESVDASGIDTSFLGHSAYAEVRAVMADIYNIIRHRQRAEQRFGLVKVDEPPDPYWRFRH
jgi:esterase/lipase superfamily enzyme